MPSPWYSLLALIKLTICLWPHPIQMRSFWNFSTKHPIAQRTGCSWNKSRRTKLIGTFRNSSPNYSVLRRKSNCPPWESFTTSCCRSSKINVCDFFHIQGLHIFASIVSDFYRSSCTAWFINFSFHWLWYSWRFHISNVPDGIADIDIWFHNRTILIPLIDRE
jgi:hypothetical protein